MLQISLLVLDLIQLLDSEVSLFIRLLLLILTLVSKLSLCSEHGWQKLSILLNLNQLFSQLLLVLLRLLDSWNYPLVLPRQLFLGCL